MKRVSRHLFLFTLVIIVLIYSLTSCGKNNKPEDEGHPNDVASETYTVVGDELYCLSYNADGKIIKRSIADFNIPVSKSELSSYEYDNDGKLVSYSFEQSKFDITYDQNGNINTAKGYHNGKRYIITFTCDSNGNILKEEFSIFDKPDNNTQWSYSYDGQGRIINYIDKDGNVYLSSYSHENVYTTASTGEIYLTLNQNGTPSALFNKADDTELFEWKYSEEGIFTESSGVCPIGQWKGENVYKTTVEYNDNGYLRDAVIKNGDNECITLSQAYDESGKLSTKAKTTSLYLEKEISEVSLYKDGILSSYTSETYIYPESQNEKCISIKSSYKYNEFGDNISSEINYYDDKGKNIVNTQKTENIYDELCRKVSGYWYDSRFHTTPSSEKNEYKYEYSDDGYLCKTTELIFNNKDYNYYDTIVTTEYTSQGEISRKYAEWTIDDNGASIRSTEETLFEKGNVPKTSVLKLYINEELAQEQETTYYYNFSDMNNRTAKTVNVVNYNKYNLHFHNKNEKHIGTYIYDISGEIKYSGDIYLEDEICTKTEEIHSRPEVLRTQTTYNFIYIKSGTGEDRLTGKKEVKSYSEAGSLSSQEITTYFYIQNSQGNVTDTTEHCEYISYTNAGAGQGKIITDTIIYENGNRKITGTQYDANGNIVNTWQSLLDSNGNDIG